MCRTFKLLNEFESTSVRGDFAIISFMMFSRPVWNLFIFFLSFIYIYIYVNIYVAFLKISPKCWIEGKFGFGKRSVRKEREKSWRVERFETEVEYCLKERRGDGKLCKWENRIGRHRITTDQFCKFGFVIRSNFHRRATGHIPTDWIIHDWIELERKKEKRR